MNNFSFYKDGKDLYCLFFIWLCLSFSSLFAKSSNGHNAIFFQQHQIQGTITDGNNPLPGVTIAVKSKLNSSTISDYSGQYTLFTSPTDTLIVSFIGFKTALVPIKDRTKIEIQLLYDTTTLQEVRVNAGYYSVKESERTGSIAKISAKDIEKQPVTNVLATMQGRMAGVDIIQDSGIPGGGFQIKIRGTNSLREEGNQPLYIIDGVPYSSDIIGYSNTTTGIPTPTSPLNNINPSDIESVEVLKDADATAIYGSRGANGVVLITTKKGASGKTRVTVTASSGFGQVTKMMNLMDTPQYLQMRRQGFVNDGITSYPATDYDINGTWDQNRYTDWQKELLGGTSVMTNLQTSLSGGSDLTQYLLSGTYHTETTVLPGDFGYDKGAVHFNMNHASEDRKFKLTFSTGYTFQNNKQAATDLTRTARNLAPNAPALYNPDGSLNFENSTFQNPLAALRAVTTAKTNDLVANSVISYEFRPNWELKVNLGFTDLKNTEQRLLPSTMYDPAFKIGSSRSSMYSNLTSRQSWIIEPQLRWNHEFESSKLDVLIGATAQQQNSSRLYQYGRGFTSNSLITDIASATTKSIFVSDQTIYKYQAFFGRINYNWDEKYILNLTARRDGSSRFGPGKQFAVFAAAGAAWLFSKENFLKENSFLSFGKLRASYGSTGSDQIGDYQYLDTYVSSGQSYNGIIGMDPTRLYNPDFSWEINKKLEVAIETGFLRDRIFFTAAWYQNRSSNQLVGIPLPGTTGFSSINANLDATVQNSGFEFTLRTVNFNAGAFKWSTNFNISLAKNKLISFPGLEGSTYSNNYVIGRSTNIVKVYQYNGINPQTGLYEVEDVNKDGQITSLEDKKTIADLTPKYFGGLENQLQYKNWQLDFLFQFVKQQNYNYTSNVPGGSPINQPSQMTNAWTQAGDNGSFQINTSGQNSDAVNAYYNYIDSNSGIVDASYVRLKNIALSYDLPLSTIKGVRCRISLQGQNLLTFTPYKGGDPEFRYTGYLPPLKVCTAGIQVTF
ncbi:SusC/RagA family TonB-linked outer membrane protein [Flavobacterium pectinovorum]|uniref:SusC/RagA family TonB-linked outer membrane protein n=1 Tax=Flavobacterium pectinovorum TaxID=29533 RepID=UPI001FAC647E|nr:SusC/RagA family TonB-linked outer membrane protein [Flavobacterium pectinovorum]MCI9843610.1 SusC/RagA family TonB-linked outer membrane protein [Flavobacterium pectinovorum]